VFNEIHLWAVIFSVIVINYIFQDGKTDYFQGRDIEPFVTIIQYKKISFGNVFMYFMNLESSANI